jgi:DNA mismatch repair ATPase MutS
MCEPLQAPPPPPYSDSFLQSSVGGKLDEKTLREKIRELMSILGSLRRLMERLTREEMARRKRLRELAKSNPSITEELILQESPKDRAIKALDGKIAALKKVFTDLNEELKVRRSSKAVPLGLDKVGVTDRHFEESGQVLAA